jgi:hypothetical protein
MPDRYAPDRYDNRDLDALVDEALASYTAAEPDPSLRVRIMANAAEARPRPKRLPKGLWLLAPAAACAAALAIAFLYHPAAPAPHPEPHATASTASAPEAPAPVSSVPRQTTHPHPALAAHRSRRGERPALLRDASFPSPKPLTAQEIIVLKFAMQHPAQARQVLTAPAARPIENAPLSIAPIHIAALSETQQMQQRQ